VGDRKSAKSAETAARSGGVQDTATQVEFRSPALRRVLQWGGMMVLVVWVIYVAGVGVFVLTHIDQGLSSAMDLTSRATGFPVWLLVILFFFLPFSCVSAVFGLVRMRQPFGILEIHADGLLLACYTVGPLNLTGSGDWFPWGFADWSNIAPARAFRLTGMTFVGLRFIDLEAFLASRQKLTREDLVRRTRLGPRWGRIYMSLMTISSIGKYLEMIWTVQGVTTPKSTTEKDVLTWNQENYGFHIIVPGRDIPCGAQNLVDLIEKRRQTAIGVKASVPGCFSAFHGGVPSNVRA
jgi:hypothetical protein